MTPAQEMLRDLRAAAHPVRLAILLRLAEGPAGYDDLEALTGRSRQHLCEEMGRLVDAGLAERERLATTSTIRLAPAIPLWLGQALVDVRAAQALDAADAAREVA